MGKQALTLAVATALCLVLVSCSGEIKPEKKGGFVVRSGKLADLPSATIETDFTPEGFAVNYFTGDPTITVKNGDYYFILYGDYKPFDIKVYSRRGGRYVEDASKGSITQGFEVGLMKGEKQMFKCRVNKPLAAGVYVLEAQKGSATVGFPFEMSD